MPEKKINLEKIIKNELYNLYEELSKSSEKRKKSFIGFNVSNNLGTTE